MRGWRVKKTVDKPSKHWAAVEGGFSTKLHILAEGLGNGLRFILTGGQRHDVTQANVLIGSLQFDHVIADTAYDANRFLA